MRKNIYISGSVRTPHGSFLGTLAEMTAPQLGSIVIGEALNRAAVDPCEVDEVLFGNVIGAGLGQNVARQAALGAGVGVSTGATTVSKVCGSGMRAVISAAQAIQTGDLHLAVAGGCESMTNAPYLLPRARSGYRMGNGELVDAMIHDGLWDVYTKQHMGNCGDLCARKYGFTREAQDDFAIASFQRAIKAWDEAFYRKEVTPVEVSTKRGVVTVERDEGVAKFQGAEKLRALRAAFGPEGTVTAGNASSISDGACAMVVFDDDKKNSLGLKPQARILGYAGAAMEPDWFTVAPIQAIRRLCEKVQIELADVDLFEINEAFAVVAMVAIKELGLDHAKVNVAGGAVAIGHPIGASGARIITTLINALHQRNKRLGVAALCIGGGEALAVAIERAG